MSDVAAATEQHTPRWQPISAIDRRVIGVLVEKAKTTPDGYPMSVNALRAGCNQKNNRDPLMQVELEDVEESLARLRAAGAVGEVQGGGRVSRYRHYLYEWLGVEKLELGVMAELLLRGAQTEGELRGRAARMDPIADLDTLRPVLTSLKNKGLVLSLTPQGRGHVVTHALYQPHELEKVRGQFNATTTSAMREAPPDSRQRSAMPAQAVPLEVPQHGAPLVDSGHFATRESVDELKSQLESVRQELAAVRKDLDDLSSQFR